MTNLSDTLAALSEAATQGEWSISAYYVGTGPDERCGGMVEVDDFPNGIIDEEPATANRLSPNLEFIVALVNAYRTGQLVPVPSVEDTVRRVGEIVFQLTRFACGQQLERGRKLMSTHPFFEKHPEWWKHFDQLIDGLSLNISELVFDQKWLDEASHAVIAATQEGRE